MIEGKGISRRYGDSAVVDGVDLTIPAGGLTSIIGPNGAGKSTLLSVISRLAPLSAGSVEIAGLDVTRTPSDVLARKLAILRQDNHLPLRLTVEELVAFGRFPHSRGRLDAADRPHVERSLAWMNLTDLRQRYLDELSGGQRQRAFVAMVLCQDTDYVLLDEPLNSLDMPHAIAMMATLRRMADELGKTLVVVLHDVNIASCYSDRIIAMRGGRIVREGRPADVITTAALREIYDIDIPVRVIGSDRIAIYFRSTSASPSQQGL